MCIAVLDDCFRSLEAFVTVAVWCGESCDNSVQTSAFWSFWAQILRDLTANIVKLRPCAYLALYSISTILRREEGNAEEIFGDDGLVDFHGVYLNFCRI